MKNASVHGDKEVLIKRRQISENLPWHLFGEDLVAIVKPIPWVDETRQIRCMKVHKEKKLLIKQNCFAQCTFIYSYASHWVQPQLFHFLMAGFSVLTIYTDAGCKQQRNSAEARHHLLHSGFKSPKPSKKHGFGNSMSLTLVCTLKGWKVNGAVGGLGAEMSGRVRQRCITSCIIAGPTHTCRLTENIYDKQATQMPVHNI